ncbi:serine/threonine-protein kinase 11-interacting protein isoform X1 [Osmia bicornis bicornis]|uniref:serine/threonine-protein kinase 11-interacting protein isoform X1 n=1 Tax=Osmia bicornis bicornis TaxID=1437191 RepID=UPI001EAF1C78|nr:serine/threonine-protein kinase 11-interacting protein isoform X1 [Osmia bicornis bicornis]XP_029051045.2 serine/threonine-protein kinase 11-interacting protein isoform X1 [Osmia bicornis bicornis]
MNNFQDAVNIKEIIELGKLLHQNGDKILSASSKLSLSTTLLYNLNEAFSLIVDEPEDLEASFQVCNSSKIDIFRDLKFLHDFVQKTIGLKVTYCPKNSDITVDITKFRHLKYLELKKINIDFVKGLQGIRGQLETVICAGRKGVCTVRQLLASCGGDAGIGFVWGSLKHLALPHNALERLDTSLELAPWLQIIDLSHNFITSAEELSCLPNLKYVNLGYNKLETVPTFNKAAAHSLQVLVLKNNYIENLNGLQNIESLTELDLSYNCLMEHLTLWPLEKMSTLLWISLEGNPLSYHPKHRKLSVKYLHPCLRDSKFVLDHVPLSKSEKQLIAENRLFTIRSKQSASNEVLASLTNSVSSSSLSTSVNVSTTSEIAAGKSIDITNSVERNLSKSKKKLNVKEALIAEDDQERKESEANSSICSSYLETSKDHLETKKQILALREKYGEDNWLSSHAGTFVQDIMGLQASSCLVLTPESTVKNLDGTSPMSNTQDDAILLIKNAESETKEELETKENDVVDSEKENQTKVLNEEENIFEESNDAISTNLNIPEPPYDPEEEKGDLYLVQKKKNDNELEDLFLIITLNDIKERDAISGKLKYSWSTNSVLSCVLGRSEPVTVDIIFDTTRENRQNRRYYVEPDVAKKIVEIIGERMKKRPISLKVFKCMKCSTHFSQDTEYMTVITSSMSGVKQLKCPTCESTLVIETDEISTLDAESDVSEDSSECMIKNQHSENTMKTNLQHSESFSSIGGTEGGAKSVTTSLVHSDFHTQAQACCSATSLEESRESTPSINTLNKKYESDIEILSNPSQSSIEVLDEASRTHLTPHRKRSSEERRTTVAPSLLTIPDKVPITTGLTESSSSGSLTDSICTAYENKPIKQATVDEKSLNNSTDKEMKFTPVTNLTSMLGGLLQSIKIGSNKSLVLKEEEASNFLGSNIQYSYTDFGSIDHRIKLHIILNIFEHEKEELILLLRAEILMQNTKDTFPGCLVLSTSKVYVLKIDGFEGEDPQRWLHKEISWTMDRLRCFAPLPFKQGVLIELEQPIKLNEELHSTITFLCILQDFQRTSNFLFYITDLSLPPSCEVEFTVPEHCTIFMHRLLKNCKNYQDGDSVRLLALFSSALLKYQDLKVQLKLSSLIVTASVLVICNMQWLLSGSNETPNIIREQAMSNLIGVEHYSSTLTLNFLDEVMGQEESWVLDFVSASAVETVINSVQPPWEELFSIPLQITVDKSQNAENV